MAIKYKWACLFKKLAKGNALFQRMTDCK